MKDEDRRLISGFIYDMLESCDMELSSEKFMEFSIRWKTKRSSTKEDNDIDQYNMDDLEVKSVNSLLIKDLVIEVDSEKVEI